MADTITDYYDRFNSSKEFEKHLFRSGYVLQSAELNEIQTSTISRIANIANAIFKDGDVIRDASVLVNTSSGAVTCQSGAVYLQGAVRGVPTGSLTIATTGAVAIGIYLQQSYVTEVDDASLRDPASITQNYNEPGAGRLKIHTFWGRAGDGQSGDFYPVYTVQDGVLIPKDPPPNLDAVTQAIANYDRDSAASSYVVTGLAVTQMADLGSGEQVYSVAAGRARVNGYSVSLATARRNVYAAAPDLLTITAEPHVSTGTGSQRVNFNSAPAQSITAIQITAQKTVTITHANFSGGSDLLPDNTVLSISNVSQGGTTYVNPADYLLTGNSVNWSPAGAEPATGTTYSVTYTYIATITADSSDATGFNVTGAVTSSTILVTYKQMLPRYDRLALNADGALTWIKGVAAVVNAQPPAVPPSMISLATVKQNWDATRTTVNDSVRVVPMSDIANLNGRIDYILGIVAQQTLQQSANLIDASQKQGLFVDPFLDDSQRDAGLAQTAAVFEGRLTLPVAVLKVGQMGTDVTARSALPYTLSSIVEQTAITGTILVNPYQAFDPIPASVTLVPAVDTWTVVNSTWASPITRRVTVGSGNASNTSSAVSTAILSTASAAAETLRPITVAFQITGFGPNEVLSGVTFDGVAVTAS
jgi:hypothetical protein